MVDSRLEVLARVVGRVEGKACRLARLATRVAVVGAVAGLVLWWVVAGEGVTDWWRGTVASLLVLALLLAPAAWLVNVRFALLELVELPEKLAGVATRRAGRLRTGPPAERPPDEGPLVAARSLWGVLRDYGDVVGAWGAVAQLVPPPFWIITGLAVLAVPVLVVVAALTGAAHLAA